MPNMTGPQHAEELISKLQEATMVEAHLAPDTRHEHSDDLASSDGQVLTMFIAGPNGSGGYLIEVRHLDEETTDGIVQGVIESAEHAAGWDPTP